MSRPSSSRESASQSTITAIEPASAPSISAVETSCTPKRRPFDEVHPKDQQIKQTKRLCIEANWRCDILDAVPAEFRPKVEKKKGSKVRVGDPDSHDEHWWNWSVEFLKSIDELSSMTVHDHDHAYNLLKVEVEARHMNPKSPQRRILELLLGDVQRVLEEVRTRLAEANTQNSIHNDSMFGVNHQQLLIEPQQPTLNPYAQYQSEYANAKRLKAAPSTPSYSPITDSGTSAGYTHDGTPSHAARDTRAFSSSDQSRAYGSTAARPQILPATTRAPTSYSREDWRADLAAAENLRAKAKRLRAEAAKFEAEAAEMEAAARELREQAE